MFQEASSEPVELSNNKLWASSNSALVFSWTGILRWFVVGSKMYPSGHTMSFEQENIKIELSFDAKHSG